MKLSYHKYYIEHKTNRYQHNLLPFLERFTEVDSKSFKNDFYNHGDKLFLFRLINQMFLFVVTKDTEIIKSINSDNFSHEDIQDKLASNENIGFASYIYFSNNYYGMASTFYGPKNHIFNNFVNDIFKKLGLTGYSFQSMSFPLEANRRTAKELAFKSAVRFDISKSNPLFDHISGYFNNPKDTDKISIQFKPTPRGHMDDTFDKLMDNLNDDGLKNFVAKGKETLQDSLTDFYITGVGHIADSITVKGENQICNSIKDKISKNSHLIKGIEEYENDRSYIRKNLENLAIFNDLDVWNMLI